MAKNYYDITLALAGVCQAARLVQQLAHQGHCDSDALHVSLNSIIDLDPESTLAVFGGSEANLRLGLETLLGCSIPAAVRASMRNSPAIP
ncbi:putative lysogenization regulator [Klebsiella pneumoniae]|uniref:Putative lysogenization regulator n=1 Tax=Klebsiella pneumoniae TaxID=573 RepID=A0A2X3F231_KLEPN|nr:putative lysogenization regulator [Klebsiella pneumoniae]STU81158.1 putative lysogenization regulator [Klebsiella pneumoniae]